MGNQLSQCNRASFKAACVTTCTSIAEYCTTAKKYYEKLPKRLQEFAETKFCELFQDYLHRRLTRVKVFTLLIKCKDEDGVYNNAFRACEAYYQCSFGTIYLEGSRVSFADSMRYTVTPGTEVVCTDSVTVGEAQVQLRVCWRFVGNGDERYFELTCDPRHKNLLMEVYFPKLVLEPFDTSLKKIEFFYCNMNLRNWVSIPYTSCSFESIILENDLKEDIMDDLKNFLERGDFCRRIGKTWKVCYLIHGPPHAGKSSLVSAIAKHTKFNVYLLELDSIPDQEILRNLLTKISRKSILVIKDTSDDSVPAHQTQNVKQFVKTLEAYWFNDGDEQLTIISTTNKDRLPMLLEVSGVSLEIQLSYMNMNMFKKMAAHFFDIASHDLYGEIESLLDNTEVTPCQVADELIRGEDVDQSLRNVISLLNRKLKG